MLGGFLIVIWFICPLMWGVSVSSHHLADLFFTLHYSQERVVLAIHAHICRHGVRQHWCPVRSQCSYHQQRVRPDEIRAIFSTVPTDDLRFHVWHNFRDLSRGCGPHVALVSQRYYPPVP